MLDDYRIMSQTAYYNNECYIHIVDKQESRQFLIKKSRSVYFSQRSLIYPLQEVFSRNKSREDTLDVFRFLEVEVIKKSPKEESNNNLDNETSSKESNSPTTKEQLGRRTVGQLVVDDIIY